MTTLTPIDCTCLELEATGLDPVTILWRDFAPGHGAVTLICYGEAWTAYWNGMGNRKVLQFFCETEVSYLANKLWSPYMPRQKARVAYLNKIVAAVQLALQEYRKEHDNRD